MEKKYFSKGGPKGFFAWQKKIFTTKFIQNDAKMISRNF